MASPQLHQCYRPLRRAAHTPQCRNTIKLTPDFLDAPYGQAAVCFLQVQGLASLTAWSAQLTRVHIYAMLEMLSDEHLPLS